MRSARFPGLRILQSTTTRSCEMLFRRSLLFVDENQTRDAHPTATRRGTTIVRLQSQAGPSEISENELRVCWHAKEATVTRRYSCQLFSEPTIINTIRTSPATGVTNFCTSSAFRRSQRRLDCLAAASLSRRPDPHSTSKVTLRGEQLQTIRILHTEYWKRASTEQIK